MYEYVRKPEYAPIRQELEKIIINAQREMRKKHKTTFQFRLIGSGKRHLITRIHGGNKGYDFDYNLILPPPGNGYHYEADTLKRDFMDAFKTALKGTRYSFPKDSASVIRIKAVDKSNKKICHSCDFAIIYYGNCDGNDGYYYLRNNKKPGTYEFAFRAINSDIDKKVHDIIGKNGWPCIKKEYLRLKNINEGNSKPSYSLYTEAVSNVYNQMFRQ